MQGRGDRIFLLTHVMVHVLSIILTVVFLSNVADHAQTNSVEGDYFAAVRFCDSPQYLTSTPLTALCPMTRS